MTANTTSTETSTLDAWRNAVAALETADNEDAAHARLVAIEEQIIADQSNTPESVSAKLWLALHSSTDDLGTCRMIGTADLGKLADCGLTDIGQRALFSALMGLAAMDNNTTNTFADALSSYEAAKADVQANAMPHHSASNDALYDRLQEVFDAKVNACHQAAIALAKAPVASLGDLLVKVRVMAESELDLTPSRQGEAYVEILADLEALA